MLQGGDFTRGDGTGGESIYGAKFADEPFILKHASAGLLSMANAGPNTNGSQFFITFAAAPHLDGKHVVFGRLVSGESILKLLERVSTNAQDRPRVPVAIADCGMVETAGSSSSSLESSYAATSSSPPAPEIQTSKELFAGVRTKALEEKLASVGLPTSFGGRTARGKAGVAAAASAASQGYVSADSYKTFTSNVSGRGAGGEGTGRGAEALSVGLSMSHDAAELPVESSGVGEQRDMLKPSGENDGSSSSSSSSAPPMNPTQARLFALRLRMNAGRKDNHKEVVEEYKRGVGEASKGARRVLGGGDEGAHDEEEGGRAGKRGRSEVESGTDSKSMNAPVARHLHVSAADAADSQAREEEKMARMAGFGIPGVAQIEAQFRTYERGVKEAKRSSNNPDGSSSSSSSALSAPLGTSTLRCDAGGGAGIMVSASVLSRSSAQPPPSDRLHALAEGVKAADAARAHTSRRRTVDEEVGGGAYINEKNRAYLARLSAATDKYTVGIKQALERGSAL